MSLFTRISVAFAALTTLAAVATGAFLVRGSNRSLIESAKRELEVESSLQATRLRSEVDEFMRDVSLVAGTPPIQGIIRARANAGVDPFDGSTEEIWRDRLAAIFSTQLETNPRYRQVRYIGLADGGREIVRVDRDGPSGEVATTPPEALQQKGSHDYVARAAELDPGAIFLSDISINREHGEIAEPRTPMLRASTPIVSELDGRPFGVVVINVDAQDLLSDITRVADEGRTFYIARADGQLLSRQDAAGLVDFAQGERPGDLSDLPIIAALEPAANSVITRVEHDRGQIATARYVALGSREAGLSLLLVGTEEISQVVKANRAAATHIAVVVAVLAVVAVLFGLWLASLATRPLTQLVAAVKSTERGDRAFELPPELSGEAKHLGDVLAAAFETRQEAEDRLKRLNDELEDRVRMRTAELERSNSELERSNSELEDFAYVASHDLKEPLRGIGNYSRFLLEDYGEKLDDEGVRKLETLSRLTDRLTVLIDTLLRFSRLGTVDLEPESRALGELLRDVLEGLEFAIEEASAEVTVASDLPTVECDPTLTAEIFHNLISNAIKYNDKPEKRVEVGVLPLGGHATADARPDRAPEERVFYVRDNGIGIPEKQHAVVFRIFKRLHARNKFGGGTGAGLTIVRKILRRFGGRIWLESTVGEGSTFFFTLGTSADSDDGEHVRSAERRDDAADDASADPTDHRESARAL